MIKLSGISKTYSNTKGTIKVNALSDISLKIEDGEVISILGKSGSGKSTLLKMIGAVDRPSKGTVHYGETCISSFSNSQLSELRNKTIGFIFQSFMLESSFTAIENVSLPLIISGIKRREAEEAAKEMLEKVGLGGRLRHKPSELSGGECQRVCIARALITDPQVVLADEPTGNLDEATGKMIIDLLLKMTSGKILILVTHDKELATVASHRIVLADGKIVGEEYAH